MLRGATSEQLRQFDASHPEASRIFLATGESLPTDAVERALGYVPTWFHTYATRGHRARSVFSRDFLAEFEGRDPYGMLLNRLDVAGRLRGRALLNQSLYLWSRTVFANHHLNYLGDRVEMAHSVEGRTPLLDHRLVELVNRMPVTLQIKDDVEKHLLREATRPYVPESAYRCRKHPFFSRFSPQGRFNDLLQDTLRSDATSSIPFFDRPAVVRALDGFQTIDDPSELNMRYWIFTRILSAHVLHTSFKL
jgi:asparagine synthase (glutamine-hydrolysing)